MHEHVFWDGAPSWWDPESADDPAFANRRLSPEDGGPARWNTFANADNLRLVADDYALMVHEISQFKLAGGSCLVELTNVGIAPQPILVQKLAAETALHIVMGCGFYIRKTHPAWLDEWSTQQIQDQMETELRQGFDDTDVKPGIIGEIGTSEVLHPVEARVLEAAARAGAATGTTVNVHTHPPELQVVLDIIDLMTRAGLDPSRTYLSHLDEIGDVDYLRAVLATGVVLGFDSFGQDFYFAPTWKAKSDNERMSMLVRLLDAGYASQLVLGQDVCMKCMLKRFGGMGYDHLLCRVIPRLNAAFGVTNDLIQAMLVDNPRRLLSRPEADLSS